MSGSAALSAGSSRPGGDPVLGYLFWHAGPVRGAPADYEAALRRWHRALVDHPPRGLRASWTWRLAAPPWLVGWPARVHLDVYLVDGFADLGRLNADAPGGDRRAAHADAAARSSHGAGSVMACVHGAAALPGAARLSFCDKGRTATYPATVSAVADGAGAGWVRQMVLGPGPELLVVAGPDRPPPAGAVWSALAAPLGT
jgi:hypothetical protein